MTDYSEFLVAAKELLKWASESAAEREYLRAIVACTHARDQLRLAIHALNEAHSAQQGVIGEKK